MNISLKIHSQGWPYITKKDQTPPLRTDALKAGQYERLHGGLFFQNGKVLTKLFST